MFDGLMTKNLFQNLKLKCLEKTFVLPELDWMRESQVNSRQVKKPKFYVWHDL